MKQRRLLLALLCMFLAASVTTPLLAVGGISASKLLVPSADPLPVGAFEMEPSFTAMRSRGSFNEYGHLKNVPDDYDKTRRGSESETALGFRLTAGLLPNFEAGIAYGQVTTENNRNEEVVVGLDGFQTGLKYILNPDSSFKTALQFGLNMETKSWTSTREAGLLATWVLTDNFSIDFDASVSASQRRTEDEQKVIERGAVFQVSFGHKIGNFQPCVEFAYGESYVWRYREFRAGREAETSMNLPNDYSLKVNERLGLPATQEIDVPGIGMVSRPTPELQERVRVRQKALTARVGFTYTVNSRASIGVTLADDFRGVNVPAGRSIFGVFTFTFPPDPTPQKNENKKGDS